MNIEVTLGSIEDSLSYVNTFDDLDKVKKALARRRRAVQMDMIHAFRARANVGDAVRVKHPSYPTWLTGRNFVITQIPANIRHGIFIEETPAAKVANWSRTHQVPAWALEFV